MAGPARVLLATLLVAGLLSGCGGGGKVKEANRYVDAVNRAQTHFADTIDQLSKRITPQSTPAEDRTTLQGFDDAVDRVVGELRAIRPPDGVTALHTKLVALLTAFRGQVDRSRADLTKGTATALIAAQEGLAKATADVSSGINATVAQINTALNK
jgi:hypothetical protein